MRLIALLLSLFIHTFLLYGAVSFVQITPASKNNSVINLELVSLKKEIKTAKALDIKPVKKEKVHRPKVTAQKKKSYQNIRNKKLRKAISSKNSAVTTKKTKTEKLNKHSAIKSKKELPGKTAQSSTQTSPANEQMPHSHRDKHSGVVLKQGVGVRIGNETIVIKRGAEGGRTLGALAAYSFNEDYFYGDYETSTGRKVEIIDARKECGRLILHDEKTGLRRKLKHAGMGDFIYTYGPSYDEDYPVKGTIVFLPGGGHWIQRFMWLPPEGPSIYPDKKRKQN